MIRETAPMMTWPRTRSRRFEPWPLTMNLLVKMKEKEWPKAPTRPRMMPRRSMGWHCTGQGDRSKRVVKDQGEDLDLEVEGLGLR